MFRTRFTDGGELRAHGGGRRSARRVARDARAARGGPRPPRAGRARPRLRDARRDPPTRATAAHPLLATNGRSPASGARMRTRSCSARLSPFKASTELSDEEVERLATAIHDDSRVPLELRERGKGDSTCTSSTIGSVRNARSAALTLRACRLRGAADLRLPELPSRRADCSRIGGSRGCCARRALLR